MFLVLSSETSLYSLWAHEWNKHGTCAAQIKPLNSEIKYFSKGLEWIRTFSMSNILADAGIIPMDDGLYKIIDIYNAIKNKLKVNPAIECIHEKNGKQYIQELRICFKKDLTLTNCDGTVKNVIHVDNVKILSNCDQSKGIYYENTAEAPWKVLVQLYRLTNFVQWLTL